ncbi:hypothetical protein GCM10009757_39930 [Streptomyces cheonanensis]|uniref:Secreted protein n=1 Tax=Streptomyces cheonanensis TaxID=312720 RepID=A0ABN2VCB5_9ACTN|nr:hypothetical protein [Streptomyces sp. AA0539]
MFMTTGARTGRGALRGPLARGLAVAALAVGLVYAVAQDARADTQDPDCYKPGGSGKLIYVCHVPGGEESGNGGGSGGGGGGSSQPSCDLSLAGEGSNRWCEGEYACWANIPSAAYPTPDTWPEGQPSEDSVYIYKNCQNAEGDGYDEWGWHTPQEEQGPSLQERAMMAFGQLNTPEFSLAFSPPGHSIIYIDTWWWAEGAPAGEIRGSSALGVVAVGTPSHIEVDPGDGSGVMTCDFVTSESDACSYTYSRAGDYTTSGRLVYDVHFEYDGSRLELPGLPDSLESGWQESGITVTESQAVVVP